MFIKKAIRIILKTIFFSVFLITPILTFAGGNKLLFGGGSVTGEVYTSTYVDSVFYNDDTTKLEGSGSLAMFLHRFDSGFSLGMNYFSATLTGRAEPYSNSTSNIDYTYGQKGLLATLGYGIEFGETLFNLQLVSDLGATSDASRKFSTVSYWDYSERGINSSISGAELAILRGKGFVWGILLGAYGGGIYYEQWITVSPSQFKVRDEHQIKSAVFLMLGANL